METFLLGALMTSSLTAAADFHFITECPRNSVNNNLCHVINEEVFKCSFFTIVTAHLKET